MRWSWAAVAGAVALAAVAAAPVPAQDNAEVARARQTLEYYQACERARRFAPCWGLLTKRAQGEWARQGRGTATEYAEAKGAGEPHYSSFRVMSIRRSPARVVFVVEATGAGDTRPVVDRVEYALRREAAEWKMDGLRVGQSETVP